VLGHDNSLKNSWPKINILFEMMSGAYLKTLVEHLQPFKSYCYIHCLIVTAIGGCGNELIGFVKANLKAETIPI